MSSHVSVQVVNAGKSRTSEDQAVCREVELGDGVKYFLFGLFDGHGGNGASMKIAMELPLIIHQKLLEMLPLIVDAWESAKQGKDKDDISELSLDFQEIMEQPFDPSIVELISGALESSLWVMDSIIFSVCSSVSLAVLLLTAGMQSGSGVQRSAPAHAVTGDRHRRRVDLRAGQEVHHVPLELLRVRRGRLGRG